MCESSYGRDSFAPPGLRRVMRSCPRVPCRSASPPTLHPWLHSAAPPGLKPRRKDHRPPIADCTRASSPYRGAEGTGGRAAQRVSMARTFCCFATQIGRGPPICATRRIRTASPRPGSPVQIWIASGRRWPVRRRSLSQLSPPLKRAAKTTAPHQRRREFPQTPSLQSRSKAVHGIQFVRDSWKCSPTRQPDADWASPLFRNSAQHALALLLANPGVSSLHFSTPGYTL